MAYKAFNLTGKVALVTGGNSGIGLGFAHALDEAGTGIGIWGANAAKNADAQAQLESSELTLPCGQAVPAVLPRTTYGRRRSRICQTLPMPDRMTSVIPAVAQRPGRSSNTIQPNTIANATWVYI